MLRRKLPRCLALLVLFVFSADVPSTYVRAEDSLPDLIRRVKPAVVSIITYNTSDDVMLTGSGFFVRPGQILTNLHVVEGASRVEVRTFEGKGKTYRVLGLAAVDVERDLALLSVETPAGRTSVASLTTAVPEEGERIFVIGNPLRLEGSVSDGIVSAVREVPSLGRIVQITAPISHGNSGSPVFNMRGQVVGVVTIRVMNGQNINLALGASRFVELKAEDKLLGFKELAARTKAKPTSDSAAELSYLSGLNSLWLGNYESALGHFEMAVKRNPAKADAWLQVGFCKVKQGRVQEGIKAFEQALALDPESYETINKLGDAHYYAGNYAKARESYERAVRLRPRLAEGYYNLGLAHFELGDRVGAQNQARRLKPLDESLYNKLLREIEK
jgi:Trypsin-like peptidase domain/TPR repeat/Tetratricopeptide repeat